MINIIWNLRSHSSNIKDPWSQITITDTIITKSLRYFENYQNVTQTKSEQMLSGKWRDRHSQCKTATQLWWVKKKIQHLQGAIKQNKVYLYWTSVSARDGELEQICVNWDWDSEDYILLVNVISGPIVEFIKPSFK